MAPEVWEGYISNKKVSLDFSVDIFSSIITFYMIYMKKNPTDCLGEKIISEGKHFDINNYFNKTKLVNNYKIIYKDLV
jgi:hypothetical protein